MPRFLAVVEGPHDASFFGVELRRRGYEKLEEVNAFDPFWRILIPRVFPTGPRLEHVVRFPDLYRDIANTDRTCAVLVAGGDSRLVSELRATLEAVDGSGVSGICILADADDRPAQHRHDQLCEGLAALNRSHAPGGSEGGRAGVSGFPLPIPSLGSIADGTPKLGIFVLPNKEEPGTLDALLLECAQTSFAGIFGLTQGFVMAANEAVQSDDRFKALRKPAGKAKAAAGVIGNVLFPGSALSAAIERGKWHEPTSGGEQSLNRFRDFCDALFA